jgi:hypothetical protein
MHRLIYYKSGVQWRWKFMEGKKVLARTGTSYPTIMEIRKDFRSFVKSAAFSRQYSEWIGDTKI